MRAGLEQRHSPLFHLFRGHRIALPLSSPNSPLSIEGLNWEQNTAYQVLQETGISIVQGFPGSGKMQMISEIVRSLLASHRGNFRMMLVADSNRACEVLCRALKQMGLQPVWDISKDSGYPLDPSINPYTLEAMQELNSLPAAVILEDVPVVVATVHMATTQDCLLKRANDLVVID